MSAGVPYARQRVVLGADADARPLAVAFVRDEGRRQSFDFFFYFEALFFEQFDKFRLGLKFLHLYLGVVVEELFKLAHIRFLCL